MSNSLSKVPRGTPITLRNFQVDRKQIDGNLIHVDGNERHHIVKVLRLKIGDRVQFFDGFGNAYVANLRKIQADKLTAKIVEHKFHEPETPTITLFQGIPKSDRMSQISQKCSELGVGQIVPMSCQRSVPMHGEKSRQKFRTRHQRIANSAAKQSGRSIFTKITGDENFNRCLEKTNEFDLSLIFWEKETDRTLKFVLQSELGKIGSVGIFIGPEGGFSDEEIEMAKEFGVISVSLGSNILRVETAATIAVGLVAYELRS